MSNQPSLFKSKAPRVTAEDVAWMLRALNGKGWMKADEIVSLYLAGGTDRHIRAMAAASQGRIISGQRGYARTDQASVEDVNHAANWLAHQGELMIRRAQDIRKAMHRKSEAA